MSPEHVILAQVVFEAKSFRRRLKLHQGEKEASVFQERKSRIVAGFNETTGKTIFVAAEQTTVLLDELPHRRIDHFGVIYDATECEGTSLLNVRKKKVSRPGIDVEEGYRQRGGIGQQVSKKGGWLLGASPTAIAGENKDAEKDEKRRPEKIVVKEPGVKS